MNEEIIDDIDPTVPVYGIDYSVTFDNKAHPDRPIIIIRSGQFKGVSVLMNGCSFAEHENEDGSINMNLDCEVVECPDGFGGNPMTYPELHTFIGNIVLAGIKRTLADG